MQFFNCFPSELEKGDIMGEGREVLAVIPVETEHSWYVMFKPIGDAGRFRSARYEIWPDRAPARIARCT